MTKNLFVTASACACACLFPIAAAQAAHHAADPGLQKPTSRQKPLLNRGPKAMPGSATPKSSGYGKSADGSDKGKASQATHTTK
jgi:hypothetical protein